MSYRILLFDNQRIEPQEIYCDEPAEIGGIIASWLVTFQHGYAEVDMAVRP